MLFLFPCCYPGFELFQLFVILDDILLVGREISIDANISFVCSRRLCFDLIDNVAVELLAANQFFEQFVPIFDVGIEKIGEGTLCDKDGEEELVVFEAYDLRYFLPLGHLFYKLAVLGCYLI